MATKKKMLQAAAGNATGGGAALDITDVFSTYLYEGNGSSQVIENGINLGQSFGSGSGEFDGSYDYLTIPASSDFAFGTSDFTIEMWVYQRSNSLGDVHLFTNRLSSGDGNGYTVVLRGTGNVFIYSNGDVTDRNASSVSAPLNQWNHIAYTQTGNSHRVFINGALLTTGVTSRNYTTQGPVAVSSQHDFTGYFLDGYISNLRVVKGTALYTSNFTPPTSELTAVSNTVLLLGQGDDPFVDNSPSGNTITQFGDVNASTFGPFDAAEAGEGGLVWLKQRDGALFHNLFDTERGPSLQLQSNNAFAEASATTKLTAFNSDGFNLQDHNSVNQSGSTFASWTFRKAPKFFDVVTYTGDGVAGRTISHNLGGTVGSIIVKCTSTTVGWAVYHRGVDATAPEDYFLSLESANARGDSANLWNDTAPTDSAFTVGASSGVNQSGQTYVAYLFAHNDGDGEFGPNADQDIIKCGSAVGVSVVNLGWEPQWLLFKRSDGVENWSIVDSMRGIPVGGSDSLLEPNTAASENSTAGDFVTLTPTGFEFKNLGASSNYIYMAIRRGPLAPPESGTEVFAPVAYTGNGGSLQTLTTGFPVDMMLDLERPTAGGKYLTDRLRGSSAYLETSDTASEGTGFVFGLDNNTGVDITSSFNASGRTYVFPMWKRAPSFFDVVAYTGDSTAGRTVSHNLGVAPEMIIVKARNSITDWRGLINTTSISQIFKLNTDQAFSSSTQLRFGDNSVFIPPTESTFAVSDQGEVNGSGDTYIAYLFATLAGVSKVGSYTGNGTSQTIDCGFTSGARFILIKRTDSTGDWYVWDTERGIVAGNDPHLSLNTTAAEVTSDDSIDPDNSGFIVNQLAATNINVSSASYIFYSVA